MIYFDTDYMSGAHPKVMERLMQTNTDQTPGYGTDKYTEHAKELIKEACGAPEARVYFLVGGTQTNSTVIDGVLARHEGVLCAESGHINVHESGAIEATGHKVLTLPSYDGKVSAEDVRNFITTFYSDDTYEHMVAPGMLYISFPTEYGTIYSLKELEDISAACHDAEIPLFIDGARLGYGLAAEGSDVTLKDIARLSDVFYIGGTKLGALFGEAVVVTNPKLLHHFTPLVKQHGALMAKGRLLGIQFDVLMEDNLYFDLGAYAVNLADKIREALDQMGVSYLVNSTTNQIFPIMQEKHLMELRKNFTFTEMEHVDDTHRVVRICTSWATTQENVDALCKELERLAIS